MSERDNQFIPKAEAHSETYDVYYNPTEEERAQILKLFDPQGVDTSHYNLIRFNLTPEGIRRLLIDGAKQMDDSEYDGVTLLRGYIVRLSDKTFTVFWPGGLGIHDHMLTAVRRVFPNYIGDMQFDKYRLAATLENTAGLRKIFDPDAVDAFCKEVVVNACETRERAR